MKPGVMLVNTGRGALVDTAALIDGLKSGRIGSLALDVYEEEGDLFFEDRRRDPPGRRVRPAADLPNVLITAHQAFLTREALAAIAETTLANLDDLPAGRPCANEVRSWLDARDRIVAAGGRRRGTPTTCTGGGGSSCRPARTSRPARSFGTVRRRNCSTSPRELVAIVKIPSDIDSAAHATRCRPERGHVHVVDRGVRASLAVALNGDRDRRSPSATTSTPRTTGPRHTPSTE